MMRFVCFAAVAGAAMALVPWGSGVVEELAPREPTDLERHLATTVAHSDPGMKSPKYRESISFLRDHAPEAVELVSEILLDQPGSFRKWQLTYLVGEFGDETALALLRRLLDRPIPEPKREYAAGGHAIDIERTEEVASHLQAVISVRRIALHRPALTDQVVESLLEIAHEVPMATSSAIHELRQLLGDEAYELRNAFGPEHAHEFERVMPPPHTSRRLADRMQARDRQARESSRRLCRIKSRDR